MPRARNFARAIVGDPRTRARAGFFFSRRKFGTCFFVRAAEMWAPEKPLATIQWDQRLTDILLLFLIQQTKKWAKPPKRPSTWKRARKASFSRSDFRQLFTDRKRWKMRARQSTREFLCRRRKSSISSRYVIVVLRDDSFRIGNEKSREGVRDWFPMRNFFDGAFPFPVKNESSFPRCKILSFSPSKSLSCKSWRESKLTSNVILSIYLSNTGVEVSVDDWIREPKNRREQHVGLHRRRQSDEETNQSGCEQNVRHPVWEGEHVDPSGRPKEGVRSLDCGLRRFGRCEQDWHHLIIVSFERRE